MSLYRILRSSEDLMNQSLTVIFLELNILRFLQTYEPTGLPSVVERDQNPWICFSSGFICMYPTFTVQSSNTNRFGSFKSRCTTPWEASQWRPEAMSSPIFSRWDNDRSSGESNAFLKSPLGLVSLSIEGKQYKPGSIFSNDHNLVLVV